MKQMNTVRTVIYGTIAMDSDRDKRVYKILIVFSKRGLSYAIRGFGDIISNSSERR